MLQNPFRIGSLMATAAAVLLIGGTGCITSGHDDATSPEGADRTAGESQASLDSDNGLGSDDASPLMGAESPDDLMSRYVDAWNARNLRGVSALMGGPFVFHTSPEDNLPETWNRRETYSSLRNMFRSRNVVDLQLSIDWEDAEPAGDLQHPDWMEVPVIAVELSVTVQNRDGTEETLMVPGHSARFIVGQGPSFGQREAGWQIMSQWDLYEVVGDDGGERASVTTTTFGMVVDHFMP